MTAADALAKAKESAGRGGLVGRAKGMCNKMDIGSRLKNSRALKSISSTSHKVLGSAKAAFLKTGAGKSIASSLSGAGSGVLAKLGPLLANPYVLGGLAAAAAVGGGIYGGVKGWKNAGKNWGLKEGQKATATQKASSMVAGAMTFGFGGKRATKAVNAAMDFGGVNNLIKAFGGNKAVMDAKDIENFQKKCAVHISKGEKSYERMLSRFHHAVA